MPENRIPETEEIRQFRQMIEGTAGRSVPETDPDSDLVWVEGDAFGWFQRMWQAFIPHAAAVMGWVVLSLCFLAFLGGLLDSHALAGEVLGSAAFPVATAGMIGLLAVGLIGLGEGHTPALRRLGIVVCWLSAGLALVLLLADLVNFPSINWDDGPLRQPAPTSFLNILILALCLLTVDRDPPRFRWQKVLVPLAGTLFVLSVLFGTIQGAAGVEDPQSVSFFGGFCFLMVYIGFALIRPDRGLAAFLREAGPGPSAARILIPTTLLLPLAMSATDSLAKGKSEGVADLIRSLDQVLILVFLLWFVGFVVYRLQRFYDVWRRAEGAISTQAAVLNRMSDGVVMFRVADSRIVLTNPQFDSMHGYGRGELIGRPVDVLTPADITDQEIQERTEVLTELARSGEVSYENRWVRKDGTDIWSRVNSVATTIPEYGPVVILVRHDLTGEQLARFATREAELKFSQVFEESPIGICLVTPEGIFEKANRNFETLTGYSSEELANMSFSDITFPEDLEESRTIFGELFAGSRSVASVEKRYVRKDGEVIWIELTAAMMVDGEGKPHRALAMADDVSERRHMSQQLQHMADHDPLTGLLNRRRFEEDLRALIQLDRQRGVAVMVIDLDNFKFVNDSFGHSVGDSLIVRTAELLSSRLRSEDTLARQGGDEFVLVLRDIGPEDAQAMGQELVELIGREVRAEGAEHAFRVTASIGVAVAVEGQEIPYETLLSQADIAMYEAKESGRNGVSVFRPDVDSLVSQEIDWAGRLRKALENDEFLLYVQPVVRLGEQSGPLHFEILIRLENENGKVILPGSFLPAAERLDLIQEIDRWVVRHSIACLAGIEPSECPRLQINLSGRTVSDPSLVDLVEAEIERTGVDPSSLIFEVTETSAIRNMTGAQQLAERMKELGCGFALDDFGSGFASFYYLKHIAFDYVKIDGEFVRKLASDPVNQVLVEALVDISREMGKKTIAEQVEDSMTLGMLSDFSVDFVQGFYLGHPMPLDQTDLTSPPDTPLGSAVGG